MKSPTINYMSYDELLRDIPELLPLLKPYSPLNDDIIRNKVKKFLKGKGFLFLEEIPEMRVTYSKRQEKYYLKTFGLVYDRIKG